VKRRLFVATSLGAALAGCAKVGQVTNALNGNGPIHQAIGIVQPLDHGVFGTRGMARVYPDSYVDKDFRTNGLPTPTDTTYQALAKDNFASYRLRVDGLVEHPQTFDLHHLRAMEQLVQATRHDCVEGWSVVGKFGGVPLATVLGMVAPKPEAKYVVFRSFDSDDQGTAFYGSISVHEAMHPQTLLALDLNGKPIDPDHGAPVRLKIPTQLGYKSTKWVRSIQIVDSFAKIAGGEGGYWEDQGYEWYAGI